MTVYNSPPFRRVMGPQGGLTPKYVTHVLNTPNDAPDLELVRQLVRMEQFSNSYKALKRSNPRGWIGHQPAWRERKHSG